MIFQTNFKVTRGHTVANVDDTDDGPHDPDNQDDTTQVEPKTHTINTKTATTVTATPPSAVCHKTTKQQKMSQRLGSIKRATGKSERVPQLNEVHGDSNDLTNDTSWLHHSTRLLGMGLHGKRFGEQRTLTTKKTHEYEQNADANRTSNNRKSKTHAAIRQNPTGRNENHERSTRRGRRQHTLSLLPHH